MKQNIVNLMSSNTVFIPQFNWTLQMRQDRDIDYNAPVLDDGNNTIGSIHRRYKQQYRNNGNKRRHVNNEKPFISVTSTSTATLNVNRNLDFISLLQRANESIPPAWAGWKTQNRKWRAAVTYCTASSIKMSLLMINILLYCMIASQNVTNNLDSGILCFAAALLPGSICKDFPQMLKMMRSHLKLYEMTQSELIYYVSAQISQHGMEEFKIKHKKGKVGEIQQFSKFVFTNNSIIKNMLNNHLYRHYLIQGLTARSNREKMDDGFITDITDARVFKSLCRRNHSLKYFKNIPLQVFVDGVALYNSSNVKMYPVFAANLNIPFNHRYEFENVFFFGCVHNILMP